MKLHAAELHAAGREIARRCDSNRLQRPHADPDAIELRSDLARDLGNGRLMRPRHDANRKPVPIPDVPLSPPLFVPTGEGPGKKSHPPHHTHRLLISGRDSDPTFDRHIPAESAQPSNGKLVNYLTNHPNPIEHSDAHRPHEPQ